MSSKIKKDIMSVIGGRVFTSGLYFVFIGILMAALDVEDYGKYTYYYSLIAIVPFFMDLGTNNAFLSLGAKKLKKSVHEYELYKNNYLAIKYILFVMFTLFVSLLYAAKSIDKVIFAVLLTGILFSMQELMANLLAVKKKFGQFSILMPIRNILNLIVIALFIFLIGIDELNAINSFYILSIATVTSFIVYLVYTRDYLFNKRFLDFDVCKDLCSYSSWLVVYGFCTALMMRIDIFILEYYSSSQIGMDINELGYFSAAFSLGLVLPMITNSIVKVAFPNLSQMNCTKDVDKYIKLIKKAAVPVFFGVLTFAILVTCMIKMFFYQKYGNSINAFLIVSLATLVSFFTNLLLPLFYASNNTFFIAKLGLIQLIINIIASTILIYFYGAVGGAVSILLVRISGLIMVGSNLKAVRLSFANSL